LTDNNKENDKKPTEENEEGEIPKVEAPEIAAIRKSHADWLTVQKLACMTFEEVLDICRKWLYIEESDEYFILVTTAALLDRELEGDPVWLFLITPSGGMKSELLRALSVYPKAYTLDILTPNTFISGLTRHNKDTGEPEPIGGILRHMDQKVLVLKDFTTILSSDQGMRSEIYGQLRSIYDGYFEKGFGTLPEPIRVKATIGLVAGVTPIIDKYSKMTGLLGERFLKIRSTPNLREVTKKASGNAGKEIQMRRELSRAFESFFLTLDFSKAPDLSEKQADDLLEIGLYLGQMRAHVWTTWVQGAIVDMDVAYSEVPTRVTKQLRKLARIIAVIKGHEEIGDYEMNVIRRVARDTTNQKRQKIIDAFTAVGLKESLAVTDIAQNAKGLHYKAAANQIVLMEALDIVEMNPTNGLYRITDSFRPLIKSIDIIPLPTVNEINNPENGSFSALIGGEGTLDPDDPRYKLQRDGIDVLMENGGELDAVIFFNFMYSAKGHPMDAVEAMVRTGGRIALSGDTVRLLETRGGELGESE